LPGGSFRMQDAGDGVGESEMMRIGGEHLVCLVCGGGDCEFICCGGILLMAASREMYHRGVWAW
jgi:hypothetical protein